MRIILDGYVSTVKRLRVSLGTLVAIEATADGRVSPGGIAVAGATAHRNIRASAAGHRTAVACAAASEVTPAALAQTAAADVIAAESAAAEAAIERAFEAIEQVNRLMHPRAEDSDLARISSAPLHAPTKVHASIGQLLNLAKRISRLTDGVFDPCTPAQPGRLGDVEVSADETEVFCHAPVALDFGGFAKGYAVDCAIEALMSGGCTAGLVNAGGDLRVFGQRAEPVLVRGAAGELTPIELVNAAVAISDAAADQRPPEHQGYYVRGVAPATAVNQHASGFPHGASTAPGYARTYASVIATTAVVADALAKCVLLCAPAVAAHALRAFGAKAQ
jgi:FAD:protein FMN transferase